MDVALKIIEQSGKIDKGVHLLGFAEMTVVALAESVVVAYPANSFTPMVKPVPLASPGTLKAAASSKLANDHLVLDTQLPQCHP